MKLAFFRTAAQYIRPRIPILIPAGAAVIFIVTLLSTPAGQKDLHVRNYILAWHYHEMAQEFSPNSIQHTRLTAIASALLHNQTDYHFDTNLAPPIAN